MPPIDDELRAALSARAATLAPQADPFPGVARRARQIRRRRAATAVAGSALAVLGIAGGSALVVSSAVPSPTDVGPAATSGPPPTGEPSPVPPPLPGGPYALDPADPWTYREHRVELSAQERQQFEDEWALAHPQDDGSATALFAQVWEPSGQTEVVVLGASSWGVMSSSEAGPEIVSESPLPAEPVHALVALLPGDEVPRVLAVAAPEVDDLVHRVEREADTVSAPLAELAPGVGTGPFEVELGNEDVLLGIDDDQQVFTAEVPDEPSPPGEETAEAPGNLLAWPVRGTVDPEVYARARELLAEQRSGVDPATVEGKVLFGGADDAGNRFLLGQFWAPGDGTAETLGVVLQPDGEELQVLAPLGPETQVAVLRVPPAPGQSTSTLVVVPQPRTGQVDYASDSATEWQPAGDGQGYLDGVVLLDRNPAADAGEVVDRLRLWDGDGVVYAELDVPSLLCGASGCG